MALAEGYVIIRFGGEKIMAKNYATIRQEKVRSSSAADGLDAHNERIIISENVREELSHKNIHILKPTYKNYDSWIETKKEQIRERNKKRKPEEKKARFPRKVKDKKTKMMKQLALSQEFIFGHSHDALSEKMSIAYLKDAHNFISNWFDGCEILSSVIHLDEKTPHLHMHVSYFDETDCRFVQKELSHLGKTKIDNIRLAFQKEVADKYGLLKQDGTVVPKDEHQTKANVQIGELKTELAKIVHAEAIELANPEIYPEPHEGAINALKEDLDMAEVKLVEKDAQIVDLEDEIIELDSFYQKLVSMSKSVVALFYPAKKDEIADVDDLIEVLKADAVKDIEPQISPSE